MVRVIPMSVGPTAVSGVIGTDTAIGGGDTTISCMGERCPGYVFGSSPRHSDNCADGHRQDRT